LSPRNRSGGQKVARAYPRRDVVDNYQTYKDADIEACLAKPPDYAALHRRARVARGSCGTHAAAGSGRRPSGGCSDAAIPPADIALAPGGQADKVHDLFAKEVGARTLTSRLARRERVWVVSLPAATWHPTPEPMQTVQRGWFWRHTFRRVSQQDFGGLRVELVPVLPARLNLRQPFRRAVQGDASEVAELLSSQ
jgi:hypothetical protein